MMNLLDAFDQLKKYNDYFDVAKTVLKVDLKDLEKRLNNDMERIEAFFAAVWTKATTLAISITTALIKHLTEVTNIMGLSSLPAIINPLIEQIEQQLKALYDDLIQLMKDYWNSAMVFKKFSFWKYVSSRTYRDQIANPFAKEIETARKLAAKWELGITI